MNLSPELKYYLNFGHPFFMWVLFAFTLYVLYLGVQVRRTRSAEGEAKKALIQGKFNDKHYLMGSILLGMVVMGNMGGMAVTYLNNSKLFFGAHLLAGLGMTVLFALSATLAPFMKKGQDWARNAHIALNLAIVGIFGWQAITGMEIVVKILGSAPST
jgi:hypothetical protein